MAKGSGLLVGGLVIAVAVVAVPYVCGLQFEKQFRAGIEAAAKESPYPVTISRYDRGWFAAEAETQIEIPLPAQAVLVPESDASSQDDAAAAKPVAPLRLQLHHAISHGPRLSGFRLARVVTTPVWPEPMKADITALFKDQPAITLISDASFGGGIGGSVASPAIATTLPPEGTRDEPLAIKWSGVDGHYSGDAAQGTVKLDVKMPALDVRDSKNHVSLAGISLTADMTRSPVSSLWLGSSRFGVESIGMDGKGDALKVEQIAVVSDASETDGLLKTGVTMSAVTGSAGEITVQKPVLKLSFSNLDAQAIKQWREQLRSVLLAPQPTGADPQQAQLQQTMASISALLPKLLARKPAFAIEELSFDDGRGPVRISGEMHYVGTGVADQPLQFSPLDVEAHGNAELPVAVLDQLLAVKSEYDLKSTARGFGDTGNPPDPAQLKTQATLAASKGRDELVKQSWIVIDGDRARTVVDFKAGAITVNGKPFQGAPPSAR